MVAHQEAANPVISPIMNNITSFEDLEAEPNNRKLAQQENEGRDFSDDMPPVNIEANDNVSDRLAKIKQKLLKDKLIEGKLSVEEINEFYELHREDALTNDVEALSKRFRLDTKTASNLLRYYSVPVIVKYNTGMKSGHWSVIFEK
eukprot:gene14385-16974_t